MLPWVALEWMQCVEALKAGGQVCGESVEVIFSIRFLCPLLPGSYIWQHSSQQGGMQAGSRDSVVSCRYMLRTKMAPSVCFQVTWREEPDVRQGPGNVRVLSPGSTSLLTYRRLAGASKFTLITQHCDSSYRVSIRKKQLVVTTQWKCGCTRFFSQTKKPIWTIKESHAHRGKGDC